MKSLSDRIAALERQVETIRPTVIDEEDIAEAVIGVREGIPVDRHHVEALYRLIRSGIHGAVSKGAATLAFCRLRGIDRPAPAGLIDSLATALSRREYERLDDLPALPGWVTPDTLRYGIREATLSQPCGSAAEVREALLFLYFSEPEERREMIEGAVWDESYGARMLGLVEPLKTNPDPDLPLLVWSDDRGAVRTSWGDDPDGWTLIDMGFERPAYALLAHPDRTESIRSSPQEPSPTGPIPTTGHKPGSTSDGGAQPALARRVPRMESPTLSDDEIIKALVHRGDEFVRALPAVNDSLFLAVDEALRAAVLLGAQALRQCREWGIDRPHPQTAVDQAATVISYDHTFEMPDDLAALCGWATPDSETYEWWGGRLKTALFSVGNVRGALIFRLFERHGVGNLRQQSYAELDPPILTDTESQRLLRLIEQLQWDPDPDLPLLAWKDMEGRALTSWGSEPGHNWTEVDTPSGKKLLPLARPGCVELVNRGPGDWGADHYRP